MGWLLSLSPTPSPNKESSVCMGRLFDWLEALLTLSYWWGIHCMPGTGKERQAEQASPPASEQRRGFVRGKFRNEGDIGVDNGCASKGRLLNSTQGYARQRRALWGDVIPGWPAQRAESALLSRKSSYSLRVRASLSSYLSVLLWQNRGLASPVFCKGSRGGSVDTHSYSRTGLGSSGPAAGEWNRAG